MRRCEECNYDGASAGIRVERSVLREDKGKKCPRPDFFSTRGKKDSNGKKGKEEKERK